MPAQERPVRSLISSRGRLVMPVTGFPSRAGIGIVVRPWEKLLPNLRATRGGSVGRRRPCPRSRSRAACGTAAYVHRIPRPQAHAHDPDDTNMTITASFPRSTAEVAVRTRAEGSTCAAAEEADTRRLIHEGRRTVSDLGKRRTFYVCELPSLSTPGVQHLIR